MNWNTKLPKPNKGAWFVPLRWSYLPCGWQGWLAYIPFIIFLVVSYRFINDRYTDWQNIALGVFPYWVSAATVLQWFASHKS